MRDDDPTELPTELPTQEKPATGADTPAMDPTPAGLDATVARGVTPAEGPHPLPRRIASYRVVGLLGRGGMGEVYEAVDDRLRRPVAIKRVARPSRGFADARARFWREARSLASLDHPGIVRVYEFGETDEGDLFMAMELIEGRPLTDTLREPWPASFAAHAGIQIGRALAAAHAADITHRDIKPANIMVDHHARVRVVDFGLARKGDALEDRVTATGAIVGTTAYMAPEQVAGLPVTTATDVFAVGIVLYRMFSGRHPFARDSTSATALAIAAVQYPPLDEVAADVPGPLRDVVERCLKREPEERYTHAGEIADALEAAAESLDLVVGRRRFREFLAALQDPDQPHPQATSRAGGSYRAERVTVGHSPARWPWLMALLVLGGGVGLWAATRGETPLAPPPSADGMDDASGRDASTPEDASVAVVTAPEPDVPARPPRRRDDAAFDERRTRVLDAYRRVAEADAAAAKSRPAEARIKIDAARADLDAVGVTTLLADYALWDLYRKTRPPVQQLEGHDALVRNVKVGPDGRVIVSASGDKTIRVWDGPSGRLEKTLTGHEEAVRVVSFSHDGKRLVSGDGTGDAGVGKARIWDLASGATTHVLEGHPEMVYGAIFSPDDAYVLTGGGFSKAELRLWDTDTGALRHALPHEKTLMAAAFSEDSAHVYSTDADSVQVWSATEGRRLRRVSLSGVDGRVARGFFLPNPEQVLLLTWSGDKTLASVGLWDSGSGRKLRMFGGKTEGMNVFTLSDDGRYVLARGDTVRLFEVAGGTVARTFLNPRDAKSEGADALQAGVAMSKDNNLVVAGDSKHRVQVWHNGADREARVMRGPKATVALRESQDTFLVHGTDGERLWTWSRSTGRLLKERRFEGSGRLQLGLTGAWAARSGPKTTLVNLEKDTVEELDVSLPDDFMLSTGAYFALAGHALIALRPMEGDHGPPRRPLDLSRYPNPSVAAAALPLKVQAVVAVIRAQQGEDRGQAIVGFSYAGKPAGEHHTIPSAEVTALCAEPSARRTVVVWKDDKGAQGTTSRTPWLIDLMRPREPGELDGHAAAVTDCAFSHSGGVLATASLDRTIRLWDGETGMPLRALEHESGMIPVHLAFGPAETLLSNGVGGSNLAWELGRPAAYRLYEQQLDGLRAGARAAPPSTEALDMLADWYTFRGLWDWADALLSQVAKVRALEGDEHLVRGLALLQRGDVEAAMKELDAARKSDERLAGYVGWLERTAPER